MMEESHSARPLGAPTGPREEYRPGPQPFRRGAETTAAQTASVADPVGKSSAEVAGTVGHGKARGVAQPVTEQVPAGASDGPQKGQPLAKAPKAPKASVARIAAKAPSAKNPTIVERVIEAVQSGHHHVDAIETFTGLRRQQIHAAVSFLVNDGRLVDMPPFAGGARMVDMPSRRRSAIHFSADAGAKALSASASTIGCKPVAKTPAEPQSQEVKPVTKIAQDQETIPMEQTATDTLLPEEAQPTNVPEALAQSAFGASEAVVAAPPSPEQFASDGVGTLRARMTYLHGVAQSALGTFWEAFSELETIAAEGVVAKDQLSKLHAFIGGLKAPNIDTGSK